MNVAQPRYNMFKIIIALMLIITPFTMNSHFKNDSKNDESGINTLLESEKSLLSSSSINLNGFISYPIALPTNIYSQQEDTIPLLDSLITPEAIDTINKITIDTLTLNNSTTDTIPEEISSTAINAAINYSAEDSTIFDAAKQIVYLYGNAKVNYEAMILEAAYIEYSFKDNVAAAEGRLDTAGVIMGKPIFKDDGNEVHQTYLKYNFKTKTGYSKKAVTEESGAFLHSESSKVHPNMWVHIEDGKFTTCDAENPHYHFHLNKAIAIPKDKIVSGPVYLKVRKVPLPLALPFGFFPNKKESSHGIIIPGYGFSPSLGYFLKDGGYFIPLSDRINTQLLFDVYSRGSWKVKSLNKYKKRYKRSGSLNLTRTTTKIGLPELPNSFSKKNDFKIDWIHKQDAKARPNSNFGANVHFGTSTNSQSTITSNIGELTQASYNSGIQWSKTWPGRPLSLSTSARHSQNIATRQVSITLPSISLSWNPDFAKLNKTGAKKGYEKIIFRYNTNFINQISALEQEIQLNNLSELSSKMSNGIEQTYRVSSQLKFASKLISFNPNASWTEKWGFRSIKKTKLDSESETITDTIPGFIRAGDFSMGFDTKTTMYGMYRFKRSKNIKAIRHVLTPNVGLSWSPERNREITYFTEESGTENKYNPWGSSYYKANDANERFSVSYGLGNNLEMKIRDKTSIKPSFKKVKLIERFTLNSDYNFIADSLKMGNIRLAASAVIAKKINITYNSSFSPYDRNTSGGAIDNYLLQSQGKLARLTNTRISFSTRFNSKSKKKNEQDNGEDFSDIDDAEIEEINLNKDNYVDWSMPWNLSLNYTLALTKKFDIASQADTNQIISSVGTRGDITVFKHWKVGFNLNYDIANEKFTPSTIDLFWDLHCWEFTAHYSPFGVNQYFNVQLNIKSSLLKDMKLQRRFNIADDTLY